MERRGQGQTSRKSTSRPIPYSNRARRAHISTNRRPGMRMRQIVGAEVRMIDDAGYVDGNGATS
jgi:hypothetical protein